MPAKQVDTDSGTAVPEMPLVTHLEPPKRTVKPDTDLAAAYAESLQRRRPFSPYGSC